MRQKFEENRRPAINTAMQINHAIEVANILRHNIVQGSREQGDEAAKWGMYFLIERLHWLGTHMLIQTIY